ncbi:hypothetical protein [Methylosinus sp. Sm6]|uniref:hypothetical protein n=1 Tax=Methylosinus sp. Sm6 TaxID=2866948 RepID=UPI001C99DD19|nr:hypothetical protein [Methylosinus sp. Sm6]MBY6244032.1 hypothetical protein [Methylosinus sp. Sm6]
MVTTKNCQLIGFDEARDRLRFDRWIGLCSIDLSAFRIAYCPGDLRLPGRLELHDAMWRDKIAGLVVDGDLTIDGNLEDHSGNGVAAFVLARGDLEARTITLGGADVVVLGDVRASGPVFNSRGGGRFEIGGSLQASHLVTDDHATLIEGALPARAYALGFVEAPMRHRLQRIDSYHEILTPAVAAELSEGCGRLEGANVALRVIEAVRSGRAALRD